MQHASAVRSWHLEKTNLLNFYSDTCFFKEIMPIENYFANVATATTELPLPLVFGLISDMLYSHTVDQKLYTKITDVYFVTHLSPSKC
jgi:hypothetical protein